MGGKPLAVKVLSGGRVYLRPFEAGDLPRVYEIVNGDAEGRRLTGTQRVFPMDVLTEAMRSFALAANRVDFAVCREEDDQLIGEVVLNGIDAINRTANFRIAMHPEYRDQGYGSEATDLMLEYGFGVLNLHRIELEVYTINPRAIHVYEKAGFQREGVKRQNWFYNHQYYDSIVMSILDHEYRDRKHP